MKNKLFKKLLTIGLSLALAACIFSGCASMGGSKETVPPGILTITGIPEEYEGKYISADIWSIPDYSAKVQNSGTIASAQDMAVKDWEQKRYTAIKNGEVKLQIYINKLFGKPNGYADSKPVDVRLKIADRTAVQDRPGEFSFTVVSKAAIASVAFEDGAAEIKWDGEFKPVLITVTNIPEIYTYSADIQVGEKLVKLLSIGGGSAVFGSASGTASGSEKTFVRNGTTTALVFPSSRVESGYLSFPESSAMDIAVSLTPPSRGSGVTIDHVFLFSKVQLTDSKAVLDLRKGVRQ
jgi:hypothetical protein